MKVLVIDYGMGNLGSVRRSLEECGAKVLVSENPADLQQASKIILPGVGAFPDGMQALRERGWADAIKNFLQDDNKSLLGICLGMQLLASSSNEGDETTGLDLIPGQVIRFVSTDKSIRIPHVGWNEVSPLNRGDLMMGIQSETDFYFVHSYHFVPDDEGSILATTPYCGHFVSAIKSGQVYGVQFHPEKSSRAGFQLLKNYLSL